MCHSFSVVFSFKQFANLVFRFYLNHKCLQAEPIPANMSSGLEIQACPSAMNRPLNGGSPSPHSADSNAPTSSQSLISSALQSSRQSLLHDGQITPSISLIPIKQVGYRFKLFIFKCFFFIGRIYRNGFRFVVHRNRVVMIMKAYRNHFASKTMNNNHRQCKI